MIINGRAMWAFLTKPNEMSGKYQMDITNLDPQSVGLLEGAGIEVKVGKEDKADYGHYVTAKSSTPVSAYDVNKNELPVTTLIGNGSQVSASINVFDWEFKGKKGKGVGLQAVKVVELVPYAKTGVSELFGEEATF